jgi:RNA polymerase sigma-70 factor (ECF subfamily)
LSPPPYADLRSDEELIAAINRGDVAAFEALYRRHRDWVLRMAGRWARDPDDALDVLQDTFLYLLGKFPGFRLTVRLTTFLYPVIKNTALRVREKRRFQLENATVEAPETVDPIGLDDAALRRRDLETVMSGLTDEQREVVLLRFVDGYRVDEIAELLRIPAGTVKSRIHYAIESLRRAPRVRHYFERWSA